MRYHDALNSTDAFDPDNAGDWYEEYGQDPYDLWEEQQLEYETESELERAAEYPSDRWWEDHRTPARTASVEHGHRPWDWDELVAMDRTQRERGYVETYEEQHARTELEAHGRMEQEAMARNLPGHEDRRTQRIDLEEAWAALLRLRRDELRSMGDPQEWLNDELPF